MNKLIMVLEGLKNSNYTIEENIWGENELILRDYKGNTHYIIEFNKEVNCIFLATYLTTYSIYNDDFMRLEDIKKITIEELIKIIKEFYQE